VLASGYARLSRAPLNHLARQQITTSHVYTPLRAAICPKYF